MATTQHKMHNTVFTTELNSFALNGVEIRINLINVTLRIYELKLVLFHDSSKEEFLSYIINANLPVCLGISK